jgi:pimeloyl-ACP methyl ester carboxylesterase
MRKALRIILISLGILVFVAIAGFVIWGLTPAQPMPEALQAMQPDAQISVTDESWLVFTPTDSQPTTGLIFYPGGHVDYRAYAPAARQIAEQGYLVVIVPMPLNLAVLDAGAAADVIAAYPEIEHWVVAGHSLGGAMAANFVNRNRNAVDGLALWAAYPAESDDLSASNLPVTSIYGTQDGLSDGEKIDASRSLLPADTTWVPIIGGNHAQFGWYGDQSGDNPAEITRQDQQAQIVAAMLAFLESIQ